MPEEWYIVDLVQRRCQYEISLRDRKWLVSFTLNSANHVQCKLFNQPDATFYGIFMLSPHRTLSVDEICMKN